MKRMNVRQRTALPQTSGARASAWRALAVVACAAVALAVSLLCARNARADGDYQDVWNHQSLDGGQQYIVGAWNVYDAAAFVCGYSHSTVSSWDLPILGKLSNAPAIVALAESFGNVTPWNDELLRDTCEGYFGSDLWNRLQTSYGGLGGIHYNPNGVNPVQLKYWQDNMPAGLHVYALNTTSENVGAAKEAFRAILAGEDTGGGGGVIDGDYVVFNGETQYYSWTKSNQGFKFKGDTASYSYVTCTRSTDYELLPSNVPVYVYKSLVDSVPVGHDLVFGISSSNSATSTSSNAWYKNINLYAIQTGSYEIQPYVNNDNIQFNKFNVIVNGGTVYRLTNRRFDNIYDAGSLKIIQHSESSSYDWSTIDDTEFNLVSNTGGVFVSSSGGSDTPDPPNNWPDDDTNTTVVAPSPPELPTPTGPSLPTEPTDDPPVYYTPPVVNPPSTDPPTNVEPPTGTDPTDYTPWLRAILLALNGISSDLSTHCLHLQNQMIAQATRIISGINNQLVNLGNSVNGTIAHWAKWLGECLGEGLNTLTDNLYDLFHWLADQFDFTFSGDPYDDSGIIGWLRRIYNRLGTGGDPKHYAPTILDPGSEGEEEPFDFWAWLLEKIASILGGVLGGATDAVTTLLDGIKGKFPFSIPWDIMAILGLLSGNRAIPVFTFTIPAIQGWWSEVPIRVDLTPYDSAATACRTMVLIWWALVLAMKSTWMVNDVLGAVSSGIVARFTGRLVGTAV